MDVALKNLSLGGRRRQSSLWKATTTLFVLLIAAPLFAQPKEEPVIYPRGTAPANAPAQTSPGGSNASLILAVVLLAGAGGWWLWLKKRDGVRGLGGKTSKLSIMENRSLGSRQYLVVADYDGKKFLLGICPGSIEMLTPLDGEKGKES